MQNLKSFCSLEHKYKICGGRFLLFESQISSPNFSLNMARGEAHIVVMIQSRLHNMKYYLFIYLFIYHAWII